jgi:hypothetical protein
MEEWPPNLRSLFFSMMGESVKSFAKETGWSESCMPDGFRLVFLLRFGYNKQQ